MLKNKPDFAGLDYNLVVWKSRACIGCCFAIRGRTSFPRLGHKNPKSGAPISDDLKGWQPWRICAAAAADAAGKYAIYLAQWRSHPIIKINELLAKKSTGKQTLAAKISYSGRHASQPASHPGRPGRIAAFEASHETAPSNGKAPHLQIFLTYLKEERGNNLIFWRCNFARNGIFDQCLSVRVINGSQDNQRWSIWLLIQALISAGRDESSPNAEN